MVRKGRAISVLVLVAGLLGIVAYWFSSRDFTPEPPRPSFAGNIAFATTTLHESLAVTATPLRDPESGDWSVLRLDVDTTNVDELVAVGLTGDARIRPSLRPDRDVALPPQNAPELLGASNLVAAHLSSSGRAWPWDLLVEGDDGDTDVIVGKMDTESCPSDFCGFSLDIPLTEPLIQTAGATWSVSTPAFGLPPEEEPGQGRDLTLWAEPRGSPTDLLLHGHSWYAPADLDVRLDLERRVADSVQLTGTGPTRALGGIWRGHVEPSPEDQRTPEYARFWPSAGEVLKVDAVFQRPTVHAELAGKDARQQFYAGIFLSLAASVLMWAMELWLGPRLGHG